MPLSERTKEAAATANIPTTTKDMKALMEWEHGQKIYGTFAKESEGQNKYIRDINAAWGKEDIYDEQMIFIDTFKLVGPQLEKLKK